MAGRTWMENYPRRSVADMIGYCEYAMKEEAGKINRYGTGRTRRFKMAKEMRLVLMDILVRQKRRNYGRERAS